MINVYKTKAMKEFLEPEAYNPYYNQHGIKINKHQLICGPTGAGKTVYITNLIGQIDDTFGSIHIYTKDITEPIYQCIKKQLKDRCVLEPLSKIPYVLDIKGVGEKLIIFDDFITEGQATLQKLCEYAIIGRKHNMTCCYLTQSFYVCPKVIRQNCAYIVLLAMCDKRNLSSIISTMSIHVDSKLIKQAINNACKFKLNVCIIDLLNPDLNKKIRRNFNEYYQLVNENGDELKKVVPYDKDGLLN